MNCKYLVKLVIVLSLFSEVFAQGVDKRELSLDSCVQIALKNNAELKVFEQNTKSAVQQYQIQKSALFPTIDLNAEYFLTDQIEAFNTYNAGNASIQLYQPIWQNGKIKSAINQTRINAQASNIQFSINKTDIVYYITISYINLSRNEKVKALTEEMLERLRITVDAAKERFRLGVSKRSDVLKAETEFSNVEYFLIQVSTSAKIAEQNLLKSIGLTRDSSIEAVNFLEKDQAQLESFEMDSLLKTASENLPELNLINKRIKQQEQSVLLQKKSQYPEIGVFVNYNWLDNPLYDKEFYGSAGVSLRLNIFSGFRKKNMIVLEKIKLNQLNFQEEEITQSVTTEIQIAKLRLIESRKKISNAMARAKSSKESLDVTREEYLQGQSSMLELVDAQYVDFEANQSLINAFADYQLAASELKRKTGLLTLEYNL